MSKGKDKKDSCVTINVYANCENERYPKVENYKDKNKNCVTINVYAKCDNDCSSKEVELKEDVFKDYDEENNCVSINVFAKCED